MNIKDTILKLGEKESNPSITISFNTNRTHPDNEQDRVVLKNLLSEAQNRIVSQFNEVDTKELLEKISTISDEINIEHGLDSMHIFLSENTQEIVKTAWPVNQDAVYISDRFAMRALIEAYSRSEQYMILLLSQGGVSLFEALNDSIVREVENGDFPFSETLYYNTDDAHASDSKKLDNLVREYMNVVDKALVNVYKTTDLKVVVICTEDNYSRLMQICDAPDMYLAYAPIDYNNCLPHDIAKQSWSIVQEFQSKDKVALLEEIELGKSAGKVVYDLQEIYQSAIDGRGDLLLVNQDYAQAVVMTSDRTFELSNNIETSEINGDIVNTIAWEVMKNKGRVVFASSAELESNVDIILKTRY